MSAESLQRTLYGPRDLLAKSRELLYETGALLLELRPALVLIPGKAALRDLDVKEIVEALAAVLESLVDSDYLARNAVRSPMD